jgi:5-(carboxyamino)imidazole ribonucleotide synthase
MIGVLGAGQLGRMLALAGYPLGLRFRFFDPVPQSPAGQVAELVAGDFHDPACLKRFLAGLELVTYEFENVPVELARQLETHLPVYPPTAALEASQDRLNEKTLFQRLGVPTAPFVAVDTHDDLERALATVGFPALLKTRRFGYDGKGQCLIGGPSDVPRTWQSLSGLPLILEGVVPFERELSQLAARGRDGTVVLYPLVENHHEHGMLRLSLAPAPNQSADLQDQARAIATGVLEALDYVGVLAIELFQVGGRLLANEMAPRVHNSGHWTIEGSETSQFENHLRAVLGWPLGSTAMVAPSAMLNLVGSLPDLRQVLHWPEAHLHLYGKTPRPGRKLGHVTLRSVDAHRLQEHITVLRRLLHETDEQVQPENATLDPSRSGPESMLR